MKTWTIEFNAEQLDMVAFCVEGLGKMLSEDLEAKSANGYRSQCEHGTTRLSQPQLRRDIKTANMILASVYKGQVNLALAPRPKSKAGRSRKAGKR